MYFESNHVIETLERLYLQRVKKMTENPRPCNHLQAMIMAAEMDALSEVVRNKISE